MKRLFLASSGLDAIKEFIGVSPFGVKMLFIPTAGNLDDDIWWIDKDREVLADMGFNITEADIEKVPSDTLEYLLNNTDIVYVAGGNTFYLLHQMRVSGFDKLLTEFVNNDGLFAGASAGALIAGLDIGPIASIDEPEKVPSLKSTTGLGLVNIVPVPHYDMQDRTKEIDSIKKEFSSTYEVVLMTDDQAIIVEGANWKLVDSKRNSVELDWLKRHSS